MNWMDQAEEAYKNGYTAGKKDAIKAIRSVPPGNREKVIAGLRCCINRECGGKTLCPYMGQCGEDIPVVMRDALSLLKEQDEEIKYLRARIRLNVEFGLREPPEEE